MSIAEKKEKQEKKQGTKKPFAVNEIYDSYLRVFADYYILRADQVTRRLHKMGSMTKVQARLKLLTDNGYLHSFQLPTVKSKSPFLYGLSAKGVRYLEEQDEIKTEVYYQPSEAKELSHPFLWHVLELNDFLIAAAILEKAYPAYALHTMRHDFSMKKNPIRVPYGEGKNKAGQLVKRFVNVWPDGWLDLRMKREGKKPLQWCIWLELDRGTEQTIEMFKEKIRRIVAAIQSGECQTYFDVKHIAAIAFATTVGEKRVETMQKWTMEVLADLHAKPDLVEMFLFSSFHGGMSVEDIFFAARWVTPLKEQEPVALLGE